MLFVLAFVLISLALPVAGEVWRHPSDNVLTRCRAEAVAIIDKITERARRRALVAQQLSPLSLWGPALLFLVFLFFLLRACHLFR
jgi:hypothetical protein